MKAEDFNPQQAFLELHATFAHQPQLPALHTNGTPLRTLLSLYPLEAETYLPYLRARFATRHIQRQDSMWHVDGPTSPYDWSLKSLLDECTPEHSRYYSDTELGQSVLALIEEYVDPQDPTSWNQANLMFEVTNVLDIASRLLHFDLARYLQLQSHTRSPLSKALASLPLRFKAYELGIDWTLVTR